MNAFAPGKTSNRSADITNSSPLANQGGRVDALVVEGEEGHMREAVHCCPWAAITMHFFHFFCLKCLKKLHV